MKLEDLFPAKPVFTLSGTSREYELRIPNLEDRIRFKEIAGSDEAVQQMFQQLHWDKIAMFVYRLLVDKSDFLAKDEKVTDDMGETSTRRVSGPTLLMRACRSIQDQTNMLTALVSALRLSDPLIDEAVKETTQKKSL